MAIFGFELEEIARLIALVDTQDLDEFIYEEEGRYLRVRGPRPAPLPAAAPVVLPSAAFAAAVPLRAAPRPAARRSASPAAKPNAAVPAADEIALESPMVGVFYRAEKPGAPPLVNVGDRISVGQVVGVLEAMKVFSEFKAEHAGVIASIPAPDGQLVQAGTALFLLKKE